jgi:phosphoenolpyruvate synthase/pyruvate phosphate dikinase
MSKRVLWLKDADDISLVGGKALSLNRLVWAGFNVPDGFVITTSSSSTMIEALEKEILEYYASLNTPSMAVRSSAVAEDGKSDAWAGQFDTFLDVPRENLIEKIKGCWASAGSERARSYAEQKNISSGKVAVIVQQMISGDVSGVAFSAHPVTNNHEQLVIEAAKGLGDKLVSGTVTPDTYVLDKKSGQVTEEHLGQNRILNNQQLQNLARTVKKIEGVYGFPVDVEWTYTGDELYILQSRPITTLG